VFRPEGGICGKEIVLGDEAKRASRFEKEERRRIFAKRAVFCGGPSLFLDQNAEKENRAKSQKRENVGGVRSLHKRGRIKFSDLLNLGLRVVSLGLRRGIQQGGGSLFGKREKKRLKPRWLLTGLGVRSKMSCLEKRTRGSVLEGKTLQDGGGVECAMELQPSGGGTDTK